MDLMMKIKWFLKLAQLYLKNYVYILIIYIGKMNVQLSFLSFINNNKFELNPIYEQFKRVSSILLRDSRYDEAIEVLKKYWGFRVKDLYYLFESY